MKKIIILMAFILCAAALSHAGFLDDILKEYGVSSEQVLDNNTVISGLKEALAIGTENAVKAVSRKDGYLANQAIRIPIPEKLRTATDLLEKVGYDEEVDEFAESMNHAAENAAGRAAPHFLSAIKDMSIEDARNILNGNDTAATDYFREKTYDSLYKEFKPVISSSMSNVGTVRTYKDLMSKYASLPFVSEVPFNLDHYVTDNALEGLFYMLGKEEKNIRTNPEARVTDLLKTVFQN
jgi:hypothetical protein